MSNNRVSGVISYRVVVLNMSTCALRTRMDTSTPYIKTPETFPEIPQGYPAKRYSRRSSDTGNANPIISLADGLPT